MLSVLISQGVGFSKGRSVTKSKECGTKDPFVLTIEGDSIFIQFKSNLVTGKRGFMAGFVTYSTGMWVSCFRSTPIKLNASWRVTYNIFRTLKRGRKETQKHLFFGAFAVVLRIKPRHRII